MELKDVRIEAAVAGSVTIHGPWAAPVVVVRGSAHRIGRVPENELVLGGPTVSRRHATIVWAPESERPTIEDLASANGTFVDGEPVKVGAPRPLADGAVVDIGEHRLGVGRPAPGARTPPPVSGKTPPPVSGKTPPASGRTPPPTAGTVTRTTRRPPSSPDSRQDGIGYMSFPTKGKTPPPGEV